MTKTDIGAPEFEYRFAVVFTYHLNTAERLRIEQVIGYLSQSSLKMPNGEGPSFTWMHDGAAVIVDLDTTKTYSDDISDGFSDFWEKFPLWISQGSKPYAKAARGKPAGFQLIPENKDFDHIEIDRVFSDMEYFEEGSGQEHLIKYVPEDEIVDRVNNYLNSPAITQTTSTLTPADTGKVITVTVPEGAKSLTLTFTF